MYGWKHTMKRPVIRTSYVNTSPDVYKRQVVIKGSKSGVLTDIDGKFSIENVSNKSLLQFSYIGMKPQDLTPVSYTHLGKHIRMFRVIAA